MSRSYRETIATLNEELLELEERRSELRADLARIEKRLAQVKESKTVLSRLEPGTISRIIGDSPSQSGLSAAIRQVLRVNPKGWVFPTDVRDELKANGYDIDQHSNVLASVHTCLKRLLEAGELETKEVEGKTAYRRKPSVFTERISRIKKAE